MRGLKKKAPKIKELTALQRWVGIPFLYILLIVTAFAVSIPFLWSFVTSLKPISEVFTRITFVPSRFSLDSYVGVIRETRYPLWMFNSLFVATCYTLLGLFFSSLVGFAFAKYSVPFQKQLFFILIISIMIPIHVTLIPLFKVFVTLRMLNTFWVLILPQSAHPLVAFIMRQYIRATVPSELLDSARLDGCSEFKIYYKIVLPVCKPALGAGAIFLFRASWNNFLWPLIFTTSSDMYTLPVGLSTMIQEGVVTAVPYTWLAAGTVVSILPMLAIFVTMQKQFRQGMMLGSIK